MTEQQRAEHNRVFEEAAAIVRKEIPLDRDESPGGPGWWQHHKLKRALSLFERARELNPANWSALWLSGKVHQALGDPGAALACYERAIELNSSQPELLRHASRCALDLGRPQVALAFMQRAVEMDPNNPGFRASLALSCLLAGRIVEARVAIGQAIAGDAEDGSNRELQAIIQHFSTTSAAPPQTPAALSEYWRKHREG